MKKVILSIVFALIAVLSINAQSIEFHQSYDSKSDNAAYKPTRVIGSYFWTSPDESMNVFSWNSFDRNGVGTLLYFEKSINNSNWFIHPEIRFDYSYDGSESKGYDIKPQIGVAYLIPWTSGPQIYLTPKVMMMWDDANRWSKPDFQFSINSSYESSKVYYEGYIDMNTFNLGRHDHNVSKGSFSVFAEEKGYYKLNDKIGVGACVVFSSNTPYGQSDSDGFAFCQPYLSFRIAM